jgi:hypothetical protein
VGGLCYLRSINGQKSWCTINAGGIEGYLLEAASPGMEREDVLKVLEKLGPVDVSFRSASYPPDEVRDTIFIKSCMHQLNNLEIYAFYNSEDRLISISLLNNKD